ncbi:MAG: hypothetical protein KJZ78_25710 [Bryobacteraceae bacterium]|nr:hypothetical protein [Fimbriimonadaceae bacterium]MCL4854772.1 hypothetical protein [Bryobacteraceae bacterium]
MDAQLHEQSVRVLYNDDGLAIGCFASLNGALLTASKRNRTGNPYGTGAIQVFQTLV